MRSLITIAMLLMVIVLAALAQTDGQTENKDIKKQYLYEWTDSKGAVHITDSLGKVPEQYRAKAHKIESRKGEESGREQQVQEQGEPSTDSEAEVTEDAKAEWQQRLKDWKKRLANAEDRYRKLDRERTELLGVRGSAALAPLENRQKAEQLEQQMKDVQQEIDEAKNMVEVVIPEEARKAGVPPGWLRE
jgi:chromosome segregation ATPase